jgi:ornithine decarboxylase
MPLQHPLARDPQSWLRRAGPEDPVYFFNPAALRNTAEEFLAGFPCEVTYAVKANPHDEVLETLAEAGLEAFDVASPIEMEMVSRASRSARLHYHNPVRSKSEVARAKQFGIASWSIDRLSELDKLGDITGVEIAVRLKLPVDGARYDFGRKFGAEPESAAA